MHKSVLLEECIENLNLKEDSVIVDCTLGYGGHSSEILARIPNGKLYAFDQDSEAIKYSCDRLSKIRDNFEIISTNFENIEKELTKRVEEVDGILYDLGEVKNINDEDSSEKVEDSSEKVEDSSEKVEEKKTSKK